MLALHKFVIYFTYLPTYLQPEDPQWEMTEPSMCGSNITLTTCYLSQLYANM